MSPDDQMKKIARDFSDWELSLEYLDLGKRSNKLKQKRMKNRFKDWGFERINIREGMEYKDKFHHHFINDKLNKTIEKIEKIIKES